MERTECCKWKGAMVQGRKVKVVKLICGGQERRRGNTGFINGDGGQKMEKRMSQPNYV